MSRRKAKDENKARALAALAVTDSLTSAAQLCGLSRPTLYSYLDDPDFVREYRQQRRRQLTRDCEKYRRLRDRGIDVMVTLMDDPDQLGATRLKAAQALVNLSTDHERRLDDELTEMQSEAARRSIFGG